MRWIVFLWTVAGSTPLAAQTAEAVLATAQQTYDEIRTIRAEFTQELRNPMMGDETTTGTLYLEPPHRFAMRFADPEGDRIVADGEWLWLYTPSTTPNQVLRQPVPEYGTATPNLFAQFVDRPAERYDVSYVGSDTVAGHAVELVRLVPRDRDLPFRRVTIGLSADGMIRHMAIVEDSGQRRVIRFDAVVVNDTIAAAEFRFRPPRGTRVVDIAR